MSEIFGIDLGTTYSCIAVVDDRGQEIVIPNSENHSTTPSVVYFADDGSVLVGESAKQYNKLSPTRVVEAVKRHMGNANWRFEVDGKSFTAQEISALILRKVAADATQVGGVEVKNVVITCPAYFGLVEREATRQAGVLAGLTVHNIISEPTAAAYSYRMGKEEGETLLVYDLGGGTFDVTVMDSSKGVFAVDGDKMLGGKDWDKAIVDFWIDAFETQTGEPGSTLRDDLDTFQSLVNDAENAKIRLSTLEKFSTRIRQGTHSVSVELTRAQFEELTAGLLENTVQRAHAVLAESMTLGCGGIDAILLVGGSTFMPQVEARLRAEFKLPIRRKNPNQIVAMGAALRGYKASLDTDFKQLNEGWSADDTAAPPLTSSAREKLIERLADARGADPDLVKELVENTLAEVAPKSFGLKLRQEGPGDSYYVDNLILRNTAVPTQASKKYSSVSQTKKIKLEAFENLHGHTGRVEMEDCEALGDAWMTFPHEVPKGHPFEVTFRLTADGLLNLEAHDPVTGSRTRGEFRAAGLMTEDEMTAARARVESIRGG